MEEPTPEGVVRTLSKRQGSKRRPRRDGDRASRESTRQKHGLSPISAFDGGHDCDNGYEHESPRHDQGRGAREYLHDHNPFRGHRHRHRKVAPIRETHTEYVQQVAHLTLEDHEFDSGVTGYDDGYPNGSDGRKDFNYGTRDGDGPFATTSSGTLTDDDSGVAGRHFPRGDPPPTAALDGPAENEGHGDHHVLHHEHDPEHPSAHHHPDHMTAPHTKEEREDAQIMAYLWAVRARAVPDRKAFSPPLSVKCGPLLRYVGLRRDRSEENPDEDRETWRGSIMIVTIDESSSYTPPPTARIFVLDSNDGNEAPKHDRKKKHLSRSGEKAGKYKEVRGLRLHQQRGCTFWRFNIEIELADKETRIAYRINKGPLVSFYVPAKGKPMNIMFHSCNGFSLGVNPAEFCGPDPLWKDVLKKHQTKPFHVMLGGGDQIYNDSIAKQTKIFQAWLNIKTPFQKSAHEFTPEMAEEIEEYYFEKYSFWFAQGAFGVANAQIPMINIWDDHDIIDGFGSYPNHFNRSPVFTGLGAVAFKWYLLFQHQSTIDEKEEHEPSWLLGSAPGPFITELSRSTFMFLGRQIAFLGLDCRTERMKDVVVAPQTYEKVFARLRKEIVPGETQHLIVLLGIPVAYPRLVWLENLLTSKIMEPLKYLSRLGLMGGLINSFDGGVELLDDLDDHWTAKNHKAERNRFIKRLQELAAEFSVRITILGGDVHLAGVGQFMSNRRLNIPKLNDHRYMVNVISSAIVNAPPPNAMADILNKRNKVHHLDEETDEDMFPIFGLDVDGTTRANKRLLPRRNYCTINYHDPKNASSSSLQVQPLKKSTFSMIRGKKASRTSSFPLEGGMDGAAASMEAVDISELMKDALQVTVRAEINQKDPNGVTKPYRFLIPALKPLPPEEQKQGIEA